MGVRYFQPWGQATLYIRLDSEKQEESVLPLLGIMGVVGVTYKDPGILHISSNRGATDGLNGSHRTS
jgi:hypothetical protein